jgi:hypothetical protein
MNLSELFADPLARQPVPNVESFLSLRIGTFIDCNEEDVEVVRIRLWHSGHSSALVSDFHSADQVLANWDKCFGDCRIVFEVLYDDGKVIKGEHEFFRKGRRKCLFATWVQRVLRDEHLEQAPSAV